MSGVEAWAIVVLASVVTYVSRSVGIWFLADRELPVVVERALRHVGPAVLAALVASIAAGDGGSWPSIDIPELAAVAMAAGVAWWRRNVLWSLSAGLATFWLLLALAR